MPGQPGVEGARVPETGGVGDAARLVGISSPITGRLSDGRGIDATRNRSGMTGMRRGGSGRLETTHSVVAHPGQPGVRTVLVALARQQPVRLRPGQQEEAEEDLAGDSHPVLDIPPGPGGEPQRLGEVRDPVFAVGLKADSGGYARRGRRGSMASDSLPSRGHRAVKGAHTSRAGPDDGARSGTDRTGEVAGRGRPRVYAQGMTPTPPRRPGTTRRVCPAISRRMASRAPGR